MKKITTLALLLNATGLFFAQNVPISGGSNYSAAVCENQIVRVWGANTDGQLGTNETGTARAEMYINAPVPITMGNVSSSATPVIGALPNLSKIDAGAGAHMLALSCTGQLWAWGGNHYGSLGRNIVGDNCIPAKYVPSRVLRGAQDVARNNANADPANLYLDDIKAFSGGSLNSFAVEGTTGYVLAWGRNDYGQLGDGTLIDRTSPVYVLKEDGTRLSGIVAVEAGETNTYALDANGHVWSWGQIQTYGLGRVAMTGSSSPRAARVQVTTNPLNAGYGDCGTAPLSGIVEISAGTNHCLALDANGHVWSFGGDWAGGQLGRGSQMVFKDCASRVVAPGVTKTGSWVESDFLGSGADGKAISIAAGQASSAVVLANGKVVTFGARGLYAIGPVVLPTNTISCPTPEGNVIMAGTLGDGNAACNGTVCATRQTANTQSLTPVYVKGIPVTEKIIQVSDGGAWYYAITNTGKVYTWGWNRRGELGLGDYTDRCEAVQFALPSGCSIEVPCAKKPNLGADLLVCPTGINQVLHIGTMTALSSEIRWYYSASLSGPRTLITGANTESYTAQQLGYYIVEISDSRIMSAAECGPCKVQSDTIRISEIPSPYMGTGCYNPVSNGGKFSIESPKDVKVKWYATPTSTTALNPFDSLPTLTTFGGLQQQTICNGQFAAFAKDLSTYSGTLLATGAAVPTVAQIATATSCAQPSWNNNEGNLTSVMIEVSQPLSLTSISMLFFAIGTNSAISTFTIHNNNPAGNMCNMCTPARNVDGKGTAVIYSTTFSANLTTFNTFKVVTVPLNVTLAPGKYWLSSNAQMQVAFNCNRAFLPNSHLWQSPYTDERGVLKIATAFKTGIFSSSGTFFDLKYEVGTGYPCPVIPVCATSVSNCVITNVEDAQMGNSLTLIPNPNRGSFVMTVPKNKIGATVDMIDALGQRVYQGQIGQEQTTFELGHLRPGVYTVRISSAEGVAVTRWIME